MPASVHVVPIAPGADPVAAVAAAVTDHPAGVGATLWLTPTPAHASSVRRRLAADCPGVIAPNVFDIQAFADELVRDNDPAARPMTEAHRRLLLDVAAAGPARDPSAAVERMRKKLHRLEPDDLFARAAAFWSTGRHRPFAAVRRVAVVGFTEWTDPQAALIRSLADIVDDIVVTLIVEEGDRRAEAFASLRPLSEKLDAFRGGPSLFAPPSLRQTPANAAARPAGLTHLTAAIFGPADSAADATGVHFIEAPGAVGEARLVARAICELLHSSTQPEAIVVTARHLGRVGDVLREVFDEYAIPFDWPEPERLARCPAVAALLRAWRLPDDDFPFADTAALLRSTFFRPEWDEVRDDADVPLLAEALLRQLGELQGKTAYLTAVRTWCESPPVPLEDEHAEEPRRQRLQRLARRCRPFLVRFFQLWDDAPRSASPARFADRLRQLSGDLGLPADAGLDRFWAELDQWARSDWPTVGPRKTVPKATFNRMLGTIAGGTPQPAAPGGGRVRVLPPEDARGADCDHLLLLGLGEGSFPDLSTPSPADPDERLSAEMLLFVELLARPRQSLHLSYPAVDEQGQPLLPSSFLLAVRECFAPGAVPVTRQRMPIEGYVTCEPVSIAELRVRAAHEMAKSSELSDIPLSLDLIENLRAARAAAAARFRGQQFGPFDGHLRHPAVAHDLAERVGPAKVFSPTALEAYVACPFKFWLAHVLRLEPLDEPGDEVEHTRRGAAVHRALARFHDPASTPSDLPQQVLKAVEEYAARAAGPATKVLWQLEGRRLHRSIARYHGHWDAFREPWREMEAAPAPHRVEAGFGVPVREDKEPLPPLVLEVGGIEVRIGGVIDRVDVAEVAGGLGFWVIDYKTGRGQHYTAAAIERFERLQLPLYAVAAQRVLFADRPARPLGLAYWMVTDTGPKPVLPGRKSDLLSWLADADRWAAFRDQLEAWVATLVAHIRAGDFPLAPRSDDCTDTCHFGPTCRIAQARPVGKTWSLALPVVPTARPDSF